MTGCSNGWSTRERSSPAGSTGRTVSTTAFGRCGPGGTSRLGPRRACERHLKLRAQGPVTLCGSLRGSLTWCDGPSGLRTLEAHLGHLILGDLPQGHMRRSGGRGPRGRGSSHQASKWLWVPFPPGLPSPSY